MNKTLFLSIRVVIAIILLQTLRYKFTGHPDSIYIFTKMGLEPFGRIGIGVLELFAAILILVPHTIWVGSLLSIGIISGAIFLHLTQLGIEINNDGGSLFYMAVSICILSCLIFWNERKKIPIIGGKF
jgi:uncharacterized membrane protein YphA (DoxX/SURF4 family)